MILLAIFPMDVGKPFVETVASSPGARAAADIGAIGDTGGGVGTASVAGVGADAEAVRRECSRRTIVTTVISSSTQQ